MRSPPTPDVLKSAFARLIRQELLPLRAAHGARAEGEAGRGLGRLPRPALAGPRGASGRDRRRRGSAGGKKQLRGLFGGGSFWGNRRPEWWEVSFFFKELDPQNGGRCSFFGFPVKANQQ